MLLRGLLASRSSIVLDRLFVPDDTYYTLAIARSLARGLGPTVDGVHLTSGFQPLLAFLLVPALRFGASAEMAFRSALLIGVCADAVTTGLLGVLAFRVSGGSRIAAITASVVWAFSSSAIAASLNGLESSLSVAVTVGALCAWLWAREKGTMVGWALSGALLGLALLTRVDTVFLVAAIGIATLVRVGPRAVFTSAAAAVAVVAPWWLYSLARFGTVIPESGAAVREQTLVHAARGMNLRDTIAWASAASVGPPLFDSRWLRQALGSGASAIGLIVGVVFLIIALSVAYRARHHDALRVLSLYVSCIFAFYAMYLPATWFFRRYLLPVHVLTTICFALAMGHAFGVSREERPWWTRVLIAVSALFVSGSLVRAGQFLTAEPTMTVDVGHHGAKGYREPARQILALAPPGAVIGSFQSGALAWFADGSGHRIVNLDGVVDGEAAAAFRDRRLAAFARARGVTHIADWSLNVRHLFERSGDARIDRASLRPIGEAESQGGNERFVLYAIDWPADL